MKQPKKKKIKNWKKKADAMWSMAIRMRYKQCEICGRAGVRTKGGNPVGGLNAHHLIGRGNLLWRHDLRNGVCLCVRCHKWSPTCSPHGGSLTAVLGFIEWMQDSKPEQWAWYDRNKAVRKTPKMTYEDSFIYLREIMPYVNSSEFPTYSDASM
jgi:hypothetical protein